MIKNNVHPLFQLHINVYNRVLYNTCSCLSLMYCLYFVLNTKLLLFHFLFYRKTGNNKNARSM